MRQLRGKAWWVDYLEKECDQTVMEDSELLLRHSKTDREVVKNLKATKDIIKTHGGETVPVAPAYYARLKERILTAIKEDQIKLEPRQREELTQEAE